MLDSVDFLHFGGLLFLNHLNVGKGMFGVFLFEEEVNFLSSSLFIHVETEPFILVDK